jgi:uncharacterized protein
MRKTSLVLSLPFLLCTLAHGASFDCAKAATAQEKAICAAPDLSAADDQMASAYHAWLAAAPPDWAAGIRDDQRIWLRTRTTSCPAGDASNPIAPCLLQVYKERIAELERNVESFAGVNFVARSVTLTARDQPDSLPPGVAELTPGFGTFQASWPQAVSASPQWIAWNAAIVAAAVHTAAPDANPSARSWSDLVQAGVDQQVTVTVDAFDSKLVSATIVNFYDGHGAHPTQNSSEFYWLLDQQRALKAEDVFLPNSGWDKWMEQRLDSYLHQTLDSESNGNYQSWFPQGNAAQVLQSIVGDPEGWQLNAKGITLVFQPYQVACYACTPDPLTLPWTDLKPYLQPGFALPK